MELRENREEEAGNRQKANLIKGMGETVIHKDLSRCSVCPDCFVPRSLEPSLLSDTSRAS